jgi:glycosyltransferase involved in cell wall biosynthesis
MRLHVIAPPRASGLAIDQRILEARLRGRSPADVQPLDFPFPGWGPESLRFRWKRLTTPSLWRARYDANVFLERIDPRWLDRARVQVLVPNQEWMRDACRAFLPRMDLVLCKTRHAETIFRDLGCRTQLTGWSSVDVPARCGRSAFPPRSHYAEPRPLHLAGAAETKGTALLLQAFARNPAWPTLTVVIRAELLARLDAPRPANVRFLQGYLGEAELCAQLCAHAIHLCPSEVEGFGHSLVEAMGCAAAVLTTDAPPMNELVTPERGVLVPAERSAPMRLGTRHFVSLDALEHAIEGLLRASPEQRQAWGHAARRWFEDNDRAFTRALGEALSHIASALAVPPRARPRRGPASSG